jgi:hypothetical protein
MKPVEGQQAAQESGGDLPSGDPVADRPTNYTPSISPIAPDEIESLEAAGDHSDPPSAFPSDAGTAREGASTGSGELNVLRESSNATSYSATAYDVTTERVPEMQRGQQSPSAQAWPEEIWALGSAEPSVAERGADRTSVDPFGEWEAVDGTGEEASATSQSEIPWYGQLPDSGPTDPRDPQPVQGAVNGSAGPTPVAEALELLASRIRSGELTVPGYEPGMSDAAALTAALAAVLGVRR